MKMVSVMKAKNIPVNVMDIGTGTGLLSMMAATAGADTITACEVSLSVQGQIYCDSAQASLTTCPSHLGTSYKKRQYRRNKTIAMMSRKSQPSENIYCIPVFFRSPYFRGFRGWTSVRQNNMTVKSANTVVQLRLNLKSAKNKNPRIAKISQTRKLGDREKNGYAVTIIRYQLVYIRCKMV